MKTTPIIVLLALATEFTACAQDSNTNQTQVAGVTNQTYVASATNSVPATSSKQVEKQVAHPDWPLSPFLPTLTLNAPPSDQVYYYVCVNDSYVTNSPGKCPICGKDLQYYERDGNNLWPRVKPGTAYQVK